jgi:RNA polymerase sigma-70 factor (ECF subfamily)
VAEFRHTENHSPSVVLLLCERITRLFADVPAESADAEVAAAFRTACQSQSTRVFSYIRFRVESADVAEDLASATFLRAFERLRTFDPRRGDVSQWIFGIARNIVNDHLRAHRRWAWLPIEKLSNRSPAAMTPEQAFAESERRRELAFALKKIRQRDRDMLGMKFGAALTNREIARVTGISERHAAVRLGRALARLRAVLVSRGMTHV